MRLDILLRALHQRINIIIYKHFQTLIFINLKRLKTCYLANIATP